MIENRSPFTLYGKPALLQLTITLLITVVIGGAVFIVLFFAGLLFNSTDLSSLSENVLTDIGEENINFLRYLMIIQSISFMIIPAIMIRDMLLPENQRSLHDFTFPGLTEIAIVVVLSLSILPINVFTGELNSGMKFPDWLSGIEDWMRLKEDEAAELTGLLIISDNAGVMILNLVIIAMLPAIGEEFLFRGVLQRIFYGFFKSPHLSVWFTSVLFSAIHLQFYGFIPRLILSLSFGYLYYWGRTIWLPVIAHFVNNAAAVGAEYLYGPVNAGAVHDITTWTRLLILPVPIIVIVVILIYFRNKFKTEKIHNTELLTDINHCQD